MRDGRLQLAIESAHSLTSVFLPRSPVAAYGNQVRAVWSPSIPGQIVFVPVGRRGPERCPLNPQSFGPMAQRGVMSAPARRRWIVPGRLRMSAATTRPGGCLGQRSCVRIPGAASLAAARWLPRLITSRPCALTPSCASFLPTVVPSASRTTLLAQRAINRLGVGAGKSGTGGRGG